MILFDRDQLTGSPRNITSPAQVTSLIKTAARRRTGAADRLDRPGGRPDLPAEPERRLPGVEVARRRSARSTRRRTTAAWAQGIVKSMTSIGVNMNFAPVVDLNVNPPNPAIGKLGRSFSANPTSSWSATRPRRSRCTGRPASRRRSSTSRASAAPPATPTSVSSTSARRGSASELEPFQQLIKAAAHRLGAGRTPAQQAARSEPTDVVVEEGGHRPAARPARLEGPGRQRRYAGGRDHRQVRPRPRRSPSRCRPASTSSSTPTSRSTTRTS